MTLITAYPCCYVVSEVGGRWRGVADQLQLFSDYHQRHRIGDRVRRHAYLRQRAFLPEEAGERSGRIHAHPGAGRGKCQTWGGICSRYADTTAGRTPNMIRPVFILNMQNPSSRVTAHIFRADRCPFLP